MISKFLVSNRLRQNGLVRLGQGVLILYALMVIYFINLQMTETHNDVTGHVRNPPHRDILIGGDTGGGIADFFEKIPTGKPRRNEVSARQAEGGVPGNDSMFKMLGRRDYILTAYYDQRKPGETYIRLLSVHLRLGIKNTDIMLTCLVDRGDKMVNVPAVSYPFNENHGSAWKGYILSCPVEGILDANPGHIRVSILSPPYYNVTSTLVLPMMSLTRDSNHSSQFAVCVPPIYGEVTEQLINMVEVTKLLGDPHFYIYSFEGDLRWPEVKDVTLTRVLDHYVEQGIMTVYPWKLPFRRTFVWYYGQVLAIHHCLYSQMNQHKYIMFQDLDELLVPHGDLKSWGEMMTDIDDDTHSGYCFDTAFFFTPKLNRAQEKQNAVQQQQKPPYSTGLVLPPILQETNRTGFSTVRRKCMVRPDRIFEMGIHHISKWNEEKWTPESVSPDSGFVHHYRRCDRMFESAKFTCIHTVPDDYVLHIKQPLMTALDAMHKIIN